MTSQGPPSFWSLIGLFVAMGVFSLTQLSHVISEGWQAESWLTTSGLLVYALAIVNALDLRLRWWISQSDTPMPLTPEGIKILNEQAALGVELVHDDDFEPKIVTFELASSSSLPNERLAIQLLESASHILRDPTLPGIKLSASLTSLHHHQHLAIDQYLELRVLPYLPMISDRPQVGLFAKQKIPRGAVFLWRSDYGLLLGDLSELPMAERMNRRPLAEFCVSGSYATLLQSGGTRLRSNAVTLANFSWCHTESVSAEHSPYRLLPPHDLGAPNCHFLSISCDPRLNGESDKSPNQLHPSLHSALMVYHELQPNDQLLIFSGEGQNFISVGLRRLLSKVLDLITPALIIAPWLLLWTQLNLW